MKGFILRTVVALIIIGSGVWWYVTSAVPASEDTAARGVAWDEESTETALPLTADVVQLPPQDAPEDVAQEDQIDGDVPDKVRHNVPFVVQAPEKQWEDERYQDACEEASILMAHLWLTDTRSPSKKHATAALEELFAREQAFFSPDTIDTSAQDTARFGRDYYGHDFDVRENITLEDMEQALASGAILIVPTNGHRLGNPYFSGDGPERHMLVVTGYDRTKNVFITNDPGTKRGEDYRYRFSTLYNAIRNYPTGHKEPIATTDKAMIVVKK